MHNPNANSNANPNTNPNANVNPNPNVLHFVYFLLAFDIIMILYYIVLNCV